MAWEAISRPAVAALSGTSTDQLRDEWYDMAVGLIADHANVHNIGEVTVVTDVLDGNDMIRIKVKRPPISSVSSLYIDDRLIDPIYYTHTDEYVVLLEDILIDPHGLARYFAGGVQNVRVTYSSGSVSDPSVSLAIALIIKELANINTSEGAASRLQFYAPGRTRATQDPLREYGLHGKIIGIIETLLGTRFKAA